MAFEDNLQRGLFSGQGERTFIDKVLAKDDVNAIRDLIKKPKLTRSELLEILYLITATESKLLNYSEWDRYVILKFFVWIREFAKVAELLFDYEDELLIKQNTCGACIKKIKTADPAADKCSCATPKPIMKLSPRTQKLIDNNSMLIQHNLKFVIDLYLNIGRTSMSVTMAGFTELLKNKYEVIYPNQQGIQGVEQKSGGFLGLGGKK